MDAAASDPTAPDAAAPDAAAPDAAAPDAAASAVQTPRIHPIFISIDANWSEFIQNLNSNVLTTPVKAKLSGEHMKIQPATAEDYRKLTTYLKEKNIPFHAILPAADRPVKLLIKGLPGHIQPQLIINEIINFKFVPVHVSVLRHRSTKKPLPLFLLTINPTEGWEKIMEINTLQETDVIIQRFRSSGDKQCYNCQAFGHSSQNCYMPPRCLKCSAPHPSRSCLKPKTEPATCANCKGAHTANWGGCPANPRNIERSINDKNRRTRHRPIDAPLPENPAWKTRNPRIYMPPTDTTTYPPLTQRSERRESSRNDEASLEESARKQAARKRAAAAEAGSQRAAAIQKEHERITAPTPATMSAFSSFAGAAEVIEAFNQQVNFPAFLAALSSVTEQLKNATTTIDKTFILINMCNGLSDVFPTLQ